MQDATENITRIQSKLHELLKKYAASVKEVELQQKTIATLRSSRQPVKRK